MFKGEAMQCALAYKAEMEQQFLDLLSVGWSKMQNNQNVQALIEQLTTTLSKLDSSNWFEVHRDRILVFLGNREKVLQKYCRYYERSCFLDNQYYLYYYEIRDRRSGQKQQLYPEVIRFADFGLPNLSVTDHIVLIIGLCSIFTERSCYGLTCSSIGDSDEVKEITDFVFHEQTAINVEKYARAHILYKIRTEYFSQL